MGSSPQEAPAPPAAHDLADDARLCSRLFLLGGMNLTARIIRFWPYMNVNSLDCSLAISSVTKPMYHKREASDRIDIRNDKKRPATKITANTRNV